MIWVAGGFTPAGSSRTVEFEEAPFEYNLVLCDLGFRNPGPQKEETGPTGHPSLRAP